MMGKVFFAALLLILFCSVHISLAQDYIVGEEDVLKVTVYDHPNLTTIARVSGDGVIKIPLIGDVRVSGLTILQISQKVASLLSDGYIVDPQVSVFIEEFRSRKAVIMGQIVKPGIYTLSGNITLLELVSKAGGLTKDAGDKAIIKRKPGVSAKGENLITVDLKRLIEEGDTSMDLPIMDSDNIYVAKAGVFYITGEVKRPDAYRYEEGTTVIKAVTMAGGFSDKASQGRVKIIRKVAGKEKIIERAGMDEVLLPDDVIVVPESFF